MPYVKYSPFWGAGLEAETEPASALTDTGIGS